MSAKKQKNGPGQKRLKVALIYPPGNYKNSEPFTMPNMSIAVLADSVIKAGHQAVQVDIEEQWFHGLKKALTPQQHALLDDYGAVLEYINGRASKRLAARCRELTDLIIAESGVEKADLYGISLVDMRTEPLILNFSALLAFALKERFAAPVAIGTRRIPRTVFKYLLEKYSCFDYGVYAEWGEKALSEIMKAVAGGKPEFVGTVVREGGTVTDYHGGNMLRPHAPTPHYEKSILERYSVTDSEIFARYNSSYPFIRDLKRDAKKRLVVLYSFEHACPGACAFCPNDNSMPTDAKSVGQIIDELSALKEQGVTGVFFINSAFNNNYKRAEELCDQMVKHRLGLSWVDCANFRVIDENLLDKMKAAGAIKLTYGMETASPRLLKYIRKGITMEQVNRYLAYSHKIGIWNHVELIGGLPTERLEDVEATIKFVKASKDIVNAYSLHPFYFYPDSPFYCQQEKFGLKSRPNLAPPAETYFSSPITKVGEFTERFDEIGGLAWEEKDRQILESAQAVADAIAGVASCRILEWGHTQLLMCLYDRFGHEKKDLIRKIMEVLTVKFQPYNLDFFLEKFDYNKNKLRLVLEKK